VHGISSDEDSNRINWNGIKPKLEISSKIMDVCDFNALNEYLDGSNFDFIFHLAAQPLVINASQNPLDTIKVNVLGSANILEFFRKNLNVKNLIVITSDKVYSDFAPYHYSENSILGASEVYGASKAMVEILINAYRTSFNSNIELENRGLATARAGNVIGGGDWSNYRLIPDIFRSVHNKQKLKIRNPAFIRPWQHVFDVSYGYLKLGKALYENPKLYSGAWNFSNPEFIMPVQTLVELFAAQIGEESFPALEIENSGAKKFFESSILSLDSTKSSQQLGWKSFMNPELAVPNICNWYLEYSHELTSGNLFEYNEATVNQYLKMVGAF
jgi:CDP-glucose 4,6-dehydratase